MTHTINTAGTVAVATDTYWEPITKETPRGVKMQCIDKRSGVANITVLRSDENFFTHWAPLPKWKDDVI